MRLCLSCCRARLASSCNGNARPWRVCALLSKPNSIVTCGIERKKNQVNIELSVLICPNTWQQVKRQGVKQNVTNPRSCCWSPNSSTFILRTSEAVLKSALLDLLYAHTHLNLCQEEKLHTHTTLSCRKKVEAYRMSTHNVRHTLRMQLIRTFSTVWTLPLWL